MIMECILLKTKALAIAVIKLSLLISMAFPAMAWADVYIDWETGRDLRRQAESDNIVNTLIVIIVAVIVIVAVATAATIWGLCTLHKRRKIEAQRVQEGQGQNGQEDERSGEDE